VKQFFAAGLGMLLGLVLLAPPAHADDDIRAERVLVVTMPYLSWADVERSDLPAFESFLAEASVANMATRIGRNSASIPDAYLTMGAGTRALAPGVGEAFEADEPYGAAPAGEVFARRTGIAPTGAVVHLEVASLRRANARTDYEARVGALGDELAANGVERAVIANADSGEADGSPQYRRAATGLVIGSDGEVPHGTLAADALLRADPAAPFGVAFDPERVQEAFRAVWEPDGRRVVVVEASDLQRAHDYRTSIAPVRAREQRTASLEQADALLGALLEQVDPSRDAVLVVAPVGSRDSDLSVVALAAPGADPGYLRSATTRRSGFVQLADIGPTVLDVLGIGTPNGMEGRPAYADGGPASVGARVEHLAEVAGAAEARDRAIPWASTLLAGIVVVLTVAFVLRAYLPAWVAKLLPTIAVIVLALIPATFLTGLASPVAGSGVLLGAALVPAVVIAIGLELLRRRRSAVAVAVALALVVAVIAADVVSGAHLQLNTLFGYSASVAGRFAGLGNLAFGFLAAATLLLAVVVTELVPGRRGLQLAIGVLVTGVLIDGLPMLGSDVGGILAMVPAFGITAMLLARMRVRPWHVVAWFAAGGGVALAFGVVDLMRPRDERTHLARFLERVDADGFSYVTEIVERRWEASLGSPRTALFIVLCLAGVLVAEYLVLKGAGERMRSFTAVPARAAMVGLAMLATIGLAANDSGLAVPGVILAVAIPVAVLRADAWRIAPEQVAAS